MSRVKIVSDGTVMGTKVYSDGVDISDTISSLTFTVNASGPERGPHVTLTTVPVVEAEIEAEIDAK